MSDIILLLQDGLVCPTDTALRDISARAVKEFFKWSVKQTSKKVRFNPTPVILLTIANGEQFCDNFETFEILHFLQQLQKNPVNVLSLLKRMYGLARHPSAFKRLGAALAFNNIYTIFR